MLKKGLLIAMACLVLLVGLVASSMVSVGAVTNTGTVTYDYEVVAGFWMVPTPPTPGASPAGFTFSGTPSVDNFGNITYAGSMYYPGVWIYHENGVKIDITNNLGYGITIRNLTAEVVSGTATKQFTHPGSGKPYGNFTLVGVDVLDGGTVDECDYVTGTFPGFQGDKDEWVKAVGTVYPAAFGEWVGPAWLMGPDSGGDAASTGHVAPVALANGATFREYFGVRIYGDTNVGTQIDGTIRLALTYEYTGAVGGISVALDMLGLLAPYIGLTIVLVVVVVTLVVVRKRKKQ